MVEATQIYRDGVSAEARDMRQGNLTLDAGFGFVAVAIFGLLIFQLINNMHDNKYDMG